MIFQASLVRSSDDNNVFDTSFYEVFNDILDNRLIDDWQHFFGHSLSLRQETRTKTSSSNNSFCNFSHNCYIITLLLFLQAVRTYKSLYAELFANQLLRHGRIGFAFGGFHDLAD